MCAAPAGSSVIVKYSSNFRVDNAVGDVTQPVPELQIGRLCTAAATIAVVKVGVGANAFVVCEKKTFHHWLLSVALGVASGEGIVERSEEHTSELQSHSF